MTKFLLKEEFLRCSHQFCIQESLVNYFNQTEFTVSNFEVSVWWQFREVTYEIYPSDKYSETILY